MKLAVIYYELFRSNSASAQSMDTGLRSILNWTGAGMWRVMHLDGIQDSTESQDPGQGRARQGNTGREVLTSCEASKDVVGSGSNDIDRSMATPDMPVG